MGRNKMDKKYYDAFINILHEELRPAMGCTEPIAIAYATALAKKALEDTPESIQIIVSGNIIKNVKSVIVPNTGKLKGIKAAAVAGLFGDAEKELEVIAKLNDQDRANIKAHLDTLSLSIQKSTAPYLFHIHILMHKGNKHAECEIAGNHTNVICLKNENETFISKAYKEEKKACAQDRTWMSVEKILEFSDCVHIQDVQEVLNRQIAYNMAIAEEGLKNDYGARIGKILLLDCGESVQNKAKAYAAAASDARMNGCELPVVINSGSGNQGITCSVPVIVFHKEMQLPVEMLYRALVVSNLVTIHLKTGIGCLSAYCGATSAGCGAGAGVTYLYGGKFKEVAHTVVNAIAINSGSICDGAKASCAAKIASSVEAGLMGMYMYKENSQFVDGDGIVKKGVENTIRNVGEIARIGMKETDQKIIELMVEEHENTPFGL